MKLLPMYSYIYTEIFAPIEDKAREIASIFMYQLQKKYPETYKDLKKQIKKLPKNEI